MNHREVIDRQIELLAQVNEQLATQDTPEAVWEIRENARVIVELVKASVAADTEVQEVLEYRVNQMEECILGKQGEGGLGEKVISLLNTTDDQEERVIALENRIGEEYIWETLEAEELPDYPHEETLLGILERVEKLEAGE